MALRMTTMNDGLVRIEPDGTEPVGIEGMTAASTESDSRVHEAAIADLRRLGAASRALRAALEVNEVLYAMTLDALIAGVDVEPAIDGIDIAEARTSVVAALVEFERARHRARGTFISAQHASGMNVKQIGATWGISRQLAHRYLCEARRDL